MSIGVMSIRLPDTMHFFIAQYTSQITIYLLSYSAAMIIMFQVNMCRNRNVDSLSFLANLMWPLVFYQRSTPLGLYVSKSN